jgi:hypothetical protein
MRLEEEKYVDAVAANSLIGVRTRIKNYMERVAEKN